ncbi:hypothetical protein NDU88_002364 [Pleurodeles waltl]|uniref:Uncharacterized protein n=1 Tax=Pleurodeles waltl TaxID=8319 RepID=A0AAV7TKH6_PLEWA|nr:hypothetical protein NDU88_002364 [Pleurodeles waltl]
MSGVGRQGLNSTKFGQMDHWTVAVTWIQLLCSREYACHDECGPRGQVKQKFCACVNRGQIPLTQGRFLLGFQSKVKADIPKSMHQQETVEEAGRIRRYSVAGSLLATLLQFCMRPEAISSGFLAEVKERSAEEL